MGPGNSADAEPPIVVRDTWCEVEKTCPKADVSMVYVETTRVVLNLLLQRGEPQMAAIAKSLPPSQLHTTEGNSCRFRCLWGRRKKLTGA